MRSVPVIDPLLRALRWHRRWFAALFAALAVLAALNALPASESSGLDTVVAARDIPGGATLGADDVRTVRLPTAMVAKGAFTDTGPLIGRTVVIPIPERSVLTPDSLLVHDSLVAAGKLALPVRFADATALPLLRVGARIDVLGASVHGTDYGVAARDVRVVAIPAVSDGGVLGSSQGGLVLVEVDNTQAAAITAAAAVSAVSFALR